jgi:hypothetical protein
MPHYYTPSPGYGRLLPAFNNLHPTSFEGWLFTAYAGALVVLLALPWALRVRYKRGDPLPLLMLGAGAITSLGEPMLDHVGHLRWAENLPGPAFSNFGLHIPALIPPCYMLFMGLEAYWIYTMIQRGITKRQFGLMAIAVGLSDAIMEHPGLAMHTYQYYGNQPFKDGLFPWYWSFTNTVAICTIAILVHFLWPRLKGRGWLVAAVLPLGIIGTTMGEFGSGFPVFLAINANMATWLQWLVGSLTLVIAVVWIQVLAELVASETDVKWTFWGLFKARFMLPHQRERFIRGITTPGTATPARANGAGSLDARDSLDAPPPAPVAGNGPRANVRT